MEQNNSRARRRKKPGAKWRVPPPIRYGREDLPGQSALEEDVAGIGGELWHMLRAVQLWARARPDSRDALFVEAGATWRDSTPAEIGAAVAVLERMAADPVRTSAEEISEACRRIAVWADGEGAGGTALEFAQVRADLMQEDALAAHLVGRMARRRGESARAESWLRHAVYLGRASRDLVAYARANLGLGNLFAERGSLPAAQRVFLRTLRAATRAKNGEIAAMALHDLFQVAAQRGQIARASRYAQAAARRYGARHARLPVLYKDVAFLWIESGWFAPALEVLVALQDLVEGIPERRLLHSAMARAAGGVGDTLSYNRALGELGGLVAGAEAGEGVAPALLNLAHGAASLRRDGDARVYATRAIAAARASREGKVRLAAEDLLEGLEAQATGRGAESAVRPDAAPVVDEIAREAVEMLAPAGGRSA